MNLSLARGLYFGIAVIVTFNLASRLESGTEFTPGELALAGLFIIASVLWFMNWFAAYEKKETREQRLFRLLRESDAEIGLAMDALRTLHQSAKDQDSR